MQQCNCFKPHTDEQSWSTGLCQQLYYAVTFSQVKQYAITELERLVGYCGDCQPCSLGLGSLHTTRIAAQKSLIYIAMKEGPCRAGGSYFSLVWPSIDECM